MHWSKPAAAALAAALLGAPLVSAQSPAAPPTSKFVVVLDAAHGGGDGGARLGSGSLERSATLALSVRLRSLLAARGITVVTTRDSDAELDADRRATIANHANAQACLSLHAAESGSGIHIFTSALAPRAAERLPAWKTAQSAYVARSTALAGTLNASLTQAGFSVTLGRTGLPGIDSMTCPALAIEIAPERASGAAVSAEPDDTAYQTRVASAIAAAVLMWRQQERP